MKIMSAKGKLLCWRGLSNDGGKQRLDKQFLNF